LDEFGVMKLVVFVVLVVVNYILVMVWLYYCDLGVWYFIEFLLFLMV